jgi:hypothetical protein
MEISIDLNLDDGFLRRACPNCEREFKWHSGPVDDRPPDAVDPPMYHCPYCGLTAESDEWLTEEQAAYVRHVVEAAAPGIISDLMEEAFRGSEGITYKRGNSSGPPPPTPPVEPNDMVAVASPCHTWEPIKVDESWDDPLHCLVCGERFAV